MGGSEASNTTPDPAPAALETQKSMIRYLCRFLHRHEDCSKLSAEADKNPNDIALARCNCLIGHYLREKRRNHWKSDLAQRVALIFTAITPVVLLLPEKIALPLSVNLLGAATAALATIATGFLAISNWRENYIRYGYIWHALQTEKYRYLAEVRKGCSNGHTVIATKKFANRVEQLVMADVTDWRDQMRQPLTNEGGGAAGGGG
jgi:hypothetical protein